VVELLGQHRYQLDAKGRFALPKRYLEALEAGAYVTLGQDRCLWVFPPEDFERYGERIRARPNPGLKMLGVVITLFDKRTNISKDI
jgi:DNA-binding transcriptional regulator/RsmH inhibitor MraZ